MAQVLLDLELLSEARAAPALDRTTKLAAGSGDSSSPPPADSPADYFLAELEALAIRAEATRDRRRRAPAERPEPESPADWAQRVVEEYEGKHAVEVAIRENASTSNVRRVRSRAGREPLYGRESSG